MKFPKKVKEYLSSIPPLLFTIANSEISRAEELKKKAQQLQKVVDKMEIGED